jgi:hypothetical protein
MKTTLNPNDFNFLLATLNEAIEEITEKKKAKQQTMQHGLDLYLGFFGNIVTGKGCRPLFRHFSMYK